MTPETRWTVVRLEPSSDNPHTVRVTFERLGATRPFIAEFTVAEATQLGIALIRGHGRCEPVAGLDYGLPGVPR